VTPPPIRVQGRPLTPHGRALYDAGAKLLTDSVDAGRAFCQFMITTSLSAVPIYLALLQLVLPKEYRPSRLVGVVLLLPALVFLLSAFLALWGYLPRTASIALDVPASIDASRSTIIAQRHTFGWWAFAIFTVGVLAACVGSIWALGVPAPPARP
jgi:hypothetical protein